MSVGTPVQRFVLSPDGARFAVSGTLPGEACGTMPRVRKSRISRVTLSVLSSVQKDRELAFAKTEQTYYKAELKKREDERKKVADRQKAVEKSLKEAEAKPIAEKKKALDKALAESDEAKRPWQAGRKLACFGKKFRTKSPDKTRTEELKKNRRFAEPEKKEKAALAETAQLEKATKQKEAALAPVLQKIEQNEKQTKPLNGQLAEVEKMIKQLEGCPSHLSRPTKRKPDCLPS